jgi:formylglycine-generating enzyme required for sulfatase activity
MEITVGASERRCLKPGSGRAFKDCPNCPEMVVVPAGSFAMGSPTDEPEREPQVKKGAESPQHQVVIARPFAIGRFSVTRAEFSTFVNETGHKTDGCNFWVGAERKLQSDGSWKAPGFEQEDRHPGVCVNWNDVTAYATWISNKTGKTYRLLSEAEREYATRAGTTAPFWWGNSLSTAQANYDGTYTYAGGAKGENRQRTLPVDSFKPNPWGLYQVHGNAYDWVEDCWQDSYQDAVADGSARTANDCTYHVLRGGAWHSYPRSLRAANRITYAATHREHGNGFRVARTLDAIVTPRRAAAPLSSAEELALKPKDSFKECDNCPEMVVVPAGSFTMGSQANEEGRQGNEGPQRQVTFNRPYAIGRFEITFAEWDACVTSGGCKYNAITAWDACVARSNCKPGGDDGLGRSARRPVVLVSWDHVKDYLAWLGKETGKRYHLPSEAEWEYAARAGTRTAFSTGSTISTEQANYLGSPYGGGPKGVDRQHSVDVGRGSLRVAWIQPAPCRLERRRLPDGEGAFAIVSRQRQGSACYKNH